MPPTPATGSDLAIPNSWDRESFSTKGENKASHRVKREEQTDLQAPKASKPLRISISGADNILLGLKPLSAPTSPSLIYLLCEDL